jgi:deazaflavin-dependent oxidoreductase (nitroreductase family)
MVERISEPKYPTGITRLLFRAPIWLYKHHMGGLLGKRFLEITHTGRKSGLPRQVVVEVVKYDPANETFYIAAAWGSKCDWVKNIQADPHVKVQVANQETAMVAQQLTPEEGESVILDYARDHPSALRNIARFMGYQVDGSQADYRQLGRSLLMFSLSPEE